MKDKTTAIILSALLGGLGVDRFYLGYIGIGVLKLLTGGVFGILWIIDIINIASGRLQPADGLGYADGNYGHSSSSEIDVFDTLKKIAKLHEDGIITDEEFAQMKKDCMRKV